ncbi:MAG: hypothetical protein ACRDLT_10590 [Solirubrobacteraceae bacterium]
MLNLATQPNPVTETTEVRLAIDDHSSFSERLREDRAAPQWVKDWVGPFWIEVHDAQGAFIDPYLALPAVGCRASEQE